jgi:hypothetical protein
MKPAHGGNVSDQPTEASKQPAVSQLVLWLLPIFLIGNFLWRTLIPAHEYPAPGTHYLAMGLDALLVVGLFGFRKHMPAWIFWIALFAGLGLFAIRLSGGPSWWTGHLMFTFPPR